MSIPASVVGMVSSECVLPIQFYQQATDSPERALMRSVLEKALEDLHAPRFVQGPRARAKLQQKTEAWFLSDDDRYVFAFVRICGALALDPGAIRRALFQPQREAA